MKLTHVYHECFVFVNEDIDVPVKESQVLSKKSIFKYYKIIKLIIN